MADIQRIVKKLSSPTHYLTGAYPRRWRQRAKTIPSSIVLCYHRVTQKDDALLFNVERGVSAKLFEAQIRLMLRYFTPVTPSEIISSPESNRLRFTVTFDDGYDDNFQVAAPILQRLGVPAAFYVASDFVSSDRRFWWEQLAAMLRSSRRESLSATELPPELTRITPFPATLPLRSHNDRATAHKLISAPLMQTPHRQIQTRLQALASILNVPSCEEGRDFPLMNWQQLKELRRRGFEIGGHTATHCNLGLADDAEIADEVTRSLIDTQNQLGETIHTFAFPYGRASHQCTAAYEALNAAGIHLAFSTERGVIAQDAHPLALPRIALNGRWPFGWLYNVDQAFAASL